MNIKKVRLEVSACYTLQPTGNCMFPLFLSSSPSLPPFLPYLSFNLHLSFLPHSPSLLSPLLPPPPTRPPPAAFLTQTVNLDDTTVKFEIWDTAGQERYHSLAPMYYRGAQAAIVVYDITNMVRSPCCLVAHGQLCFTLTHLLLAVRTLKGKQSAYRSCSPMQTVSATKCDYMDA